MKVGDLVYDSTFQTNGIIFDEMPRHEVIKRWTDADKDNLRVWMVLYEDDQINIAFDNELEVIYESR
jgi:hypothetical protein